MLGDCLEEMKKIPNNYVDTCITDPPYGYNFMGKDWDAEVPSPEYWKEVLRCLKPGAFLLCFAGTRSWHWMAISIEKGGFEIRDTIMWLHGQGFPKSYNIAKGIEGKLTRGSANWNEWKKLDGEDIDSNSRGALGLTKTNKEQGNRPIDYGAGRQFELNPTTNEAELWQGYGTALKPAWEPIIVAMKPRDGTFANNALTWGVAGLWIEGGRVEPTDDVSGWSKTGSKASENTSMSGRNYAREPKPDNPAGRWPANLILDKVSAKMLDEQTGIQKGGFVRNRTDGARPFNNEGKDTKYETVAEISEPDGGASRFFYCAKASKKEKNLGLPEGMKNDHATVKPVSLMEHLCILTKTPTGGIVLDPFMGSGTTGVACVKTGRDFIGIDNDEHYFEIATKRIEWVKNG